MRAVTNCNTPGHRFIPFMSHQNQSTSRVDASSNLFASLINICTLASPTCISMYLDPRLFYRRDRRGDGGFKRQIYCNLAEFLSSIQVIPILFSNILKPERSEGMVTFRQSITLFKQSYNLSLFY